MLEEREMVEILEGIARESSNQSARIAAIKLLRVIRAEPASAGGSVRELYEASNPGRIRELSVAEDSRARPSHGP